MHSVIKWLIEWLTDAFQKHSTYRKFLLSVLTLNERSNDLSLK